VLTWNQTQPCSELSAILKVMSIANGSQQRRCRGGPYAGYLHQPVAAVIFASHLFQVGVVQNRGTSPILLRPLFF